MDTRFLDDLSAGDSGILSHGAGQDHFGSCHDHIAVDHSIDQHLTTGGIEIAVDDAGNFHVRAEGEIVPLHNLPRT